MASYLARPQIDGKVDELAVLLHKIPQRIRLQEVVGFFLQLKTKRTAFLNKANKTLFLST